MPVLLTSDPQASVNHKKAAEGFSKGFKKIGDTLAYLADCGRILDSPKIRKALASAYVEVFKFLCTALRWLGSKWSRFSSSVQATFYDDHIKCHIDEIERLASVVDRDLGLKTTTGVLNLLDLGQALKTPQQKTSIATRFRKQDDAEVGEDFEMASKAFAQLGTGVTHCLGATEAQHDYGELWLGL